MSEIVRPTKKQREILSYIDAFIVEHGYSPSYREIMNGLQYTSVATVSLHVTSLIKRGHLRKRDHSARSLEVVGSTDDLDKAPSPQTSHETWFVDQVTKQFATVATNVSQAAIDDLTALVKSLQLLGLHDAATKFTERLQTLQIDDTQAEA